MRARFLFLFLGFFACIAVGEEPDQALMARLTGEGCEALSRLEEYFKGLHIQWNQTSDDGWPPYHCHYYPSRDGFKMQLRVDSDDPVPKSHLYLYLRNSDYFFKVHKKPDDTGWGIEECVPLDNFDPYNYETDSYYTLLPFTIYDQSLASMIKEGEVTITGMRMSDGSPDEAVVLDFTHNRDCSPKELVSGTLTLLPKKCWVISSAVLLYESDGYPFRTVAHFDYGENDDYPFFDYKLLTLALQKGQDESTPPMITWTYDIKQIDHQTVPSKELRLPFYGLPEPEFVRSVDRSRLMLVTAGLLMIAAALVIIIRKKAAAAAHSPIITEDNTNDTAA